MSPEHITKTAERLARIEANQEHSTRDAHEIRKSLAELSETLKRIADSLEIRVRRLEHRIWYAAGVAAGCGGATGVLVAKSLGVV